MRGSVNVLTGLWLFAGLHPHQHDTLQLRHASAWIHRFWSIQSSSPNLHNLHQYRFVQMHAHQSRSRSTVKNSCAR
ncbi:hypothetical protein BJ742DRAFT_808145 [Cladochytrium replicatum]|nr:hypothetical protein BJ742DRAFT_808145 [Cladochytrium replicatum]